MQLNLQHKSTHSPPNNVASTMDPTIENFTNVFVEYRIRKNY